MNKGRDGNKQFIRHLHAFRGFAILNIVAVHAWATPINLLSEAQRASGVSILHALNETLFHNSTLYFTLISGLLFALVIQGRGWAKFYRGKVFNVFLPFAFVTLILMLFGITSGGPISDLSGFLRQLVINLVSGGAMYHLWYIPVLLLLFALTPLVVWLCERDATRWFAWLLVLLPLVVSREWSWPHFSWKTVFFFLGSYTAGYLFGSQYERACAFFLSIRGYLLVAVVVTTGLIFYLYLSGQTGGEGGIRLSETLFYVQKLSAAVLVILWFRSAENSLPGWLDLIAGYSFALYFLHAPLLQWLVQFLDMVWPAHASPASVALAGLFYYVAVILLTLLIVFGLKQLFGKWSRYLVGS